MLLREQPQVAKECVPCYLDTTAGCEREAIGGGDGKRYTR